MIKKLIILVVLSLFSMSVLSILSKAEVPLWVQSTSSLDSVCNDLVFFDDFSDGNDNGWRGCPWGIWDLSAGVYDLYLPVGQTISWRFTGNYGWQDYCVSLDFNNLVGQYEKLFYLRWNRSVSGYLVFIYSKYGSFTNSRIELKKYVNNVVVQSVTYPVVTESNTWYSLHFSLIGNNIKCFLDGVQVFNYTDNNNPILVGRFGIGAQKPSSSESRVQFDNVEVRCATEQVCTPFADAEGTVTDAITSAPIQGALVELMQNSVVRYSANMNSAGYYEFEGIDAGEYDIQVSKSGYVTQTRTAQSLTANQTTTVDFQLSPLPTTGTIAGTVEDASTQQNLQGVLVEALQGAQVKGSGNTDVNGNYSISNLPAGSYDVRASKFGYQTQTQTGKNVVGGQTTTVDFQLMPLPTGWISGFVNDGCTKSGLGGVLVELLQGQEVRYSTTTETGSGLYELSGVFTGTYDVRYSKAGYNTVTLQKIIDPGWNILSTVTLIPVGYISSQPLKDALNQFCLAYKKYMQHGSDRIIDLENELFSELYLPEYSPAKGFAKDLWQSFQQPTANGVLDLAKINVEEFAEKGNYPGWKGSCQTCASALSIAQNIAFIVLEDIGNSSYSEIHGYLMNQLIPGLELKDKQMIMLRDNPPIPGQHVYTMNQVLGYLDDWNKSDGIVSCLPQGFPIQKIVDRLNDLTDKIKDVTYQELSNFPDFYYDLNWTMEGYRSLNSNSFHSFGLLNHKVNDIRKHLLDFGTANVFSRTFHAGCQLFGLGGTSYKTINLLKYGLGNKGPGAWQVLGKTLFYSGLACNSISYISGVYSVSKQASLTEALSDFNLFWPDDCGRAFEFYRQVNESIFAVTNDPTLFSASTSYNSPSINVPDRLCFSIDEVSKIVNGTVTIQNADLVKTGKMMIVGAVYIDLAGSYETVGQFKSDVIDISPGATGTASFYFNLSTPTYFNLYRDCIINVDIMTTCETINLIKQVEVGLVPDCPGRPPFIRIRNLSVQKMGEGQMLATNFTASPASKSASFSLRFGGSDIDLHVYDQSGNHVGRNYQTGQIELQIPGAQFLGDSTNSEMITIPTTPSATYQVKAFGVSLPDSEIVTMDVFEINQADPDLSTFPSQVFIDVFQGDSVKFSGTLFDLSGQNQLTIDTAIFSNFVDSLGNTLPANLISMSYTKVIPADSTVNYYLSVKIPNSERLRQYHGTLTFKTSSDYIQIPVTIKIIKSYTRGDANSDSTLTVADVVYLVNYLFKGGPVPNPLESGDVNCDGKVTVADAVYLINYLFKGGPAPCS